MVTIQVECWVCHDMIEQKNAFCLRNGDGDECWNYDNMAEPKKPSSLQYGSNAFIYCKECFNKVRRDSKC